MNITEASKASGLPADTIRFYERQGVMPPPGRRLNGYRDYSERHVAALSFAAGLRNLGIPLGDVAAMVRLVHEGSCGDVREAMLALTKEAAQRLKERLTILRATGRELDVLRTGLMNTRGRQAKMPGITPCACVELVRQPAQATSKVARKRSGQAERLRGPRARTPS
ncbi:MAG: MerR family transcriptional regulator [Dehalococcoidia bacterium]